MSRLSIPIFIAGWLLLAGCARRTDEPGSSPSAAATGPSWSQNGWSEAERAEYHHLPEGSELMPYVLVANVISVKTGKPFLENMERFGFIPDPASPTNPHGLPVGVTTVHSRDKSSTGIEMIGFNCAACHVGEVTYHGKQLLIDGAPGQIDLQGYQVEFKDSLDAALHNPVKLVELAIAIEKERGNSKAPPAGSATNYAADPALKAADDIPAAPTADVKFHSVSSRSADASGAASNPQGESFDARLKKDIAFLKARLAYIKNGKLLVNGTEPGPGRIDAFGAARNLLFPQYALRMQSPVSFPFLWDVPDNTQQRAVADMVWIHYDGDTNSILERNIGQALGMGAVFDPKTYESTLRIANLHRLEVLTLKLKPPAWPADIFGAVDQEKAKAGEKIFDATCQGCHQNRLYALTEIGTDPQRANSFGQPVAKGVPFPDAVKPILDGLKARAFADDGISPADQAAMDANPAIWRATGQYLARPLTGVWATGPYLHNGSVPSLWHLLHPSQRPAKFIVGNREYDPSKLGFAASGSGWTFDTSLPGNSNIGHADERFGANLSEDQKTALLEYLKTI